MAKRERKFAQSRDEAIAQGMKLLLGIPCIRGHIGIRRVTCRGCVDCQAQASKAYRTRNPQKHEIAVAKWRDANPDRYKASVNSWISRNHARKLELTRLAYSRDPERAKAASQKWRAANPGKGLVYAATRRVRLLGASVPLSAENRELIKQIYANRPAGFQVDHIYPLAGKNSCGLHVPWNLQYLSPRDNQVKYNKTPSGGGSLALVA